MSAAIGIVEAALWVTSAWSGLSRQGRVTECASLAGKLFTLVYDFATRPRDTFGPAPAKMILLQSLRMSLDWRQAIAGFDASVGAGGTHWSGLMNGPGGRPESQSLG